MTETLLYVIPGSVLLIYCLLGILYARHLRSRIPDIPLVMDDEFRRAYRPYADGLMTEEEADARVAKIPSFDQMCYTYPFKSVWDIPSLPRREFELLSFIFCWKRRISSDD